jgi:hypothetical protein
MTLPSMRSSIGSLYSTRLGIQDIDAGRVISSEALAREIEQW